MAVGRSMDRFGRRLIGGSTCRRGCRRRRVNCHFDRIVPLPVFVTRL